MSHFRLLIVCTIFSLSAFFTLYACNRTQHPSEQNGTTETATGQEKTNKPQEAKKQVEKKKEEKTVIPEKTTPEKTTPEKTTPEKNPPEKTTPEPIAPPKTVSFIAVGDTGTGNQDQRSVADAMKKKCDIEKQTGRGCDFSIMLGDNFYDTGVSSATDKQFQTKFVNMYQHLGFPFYISVGNHDYGVAGVGLEFWKIRYYLDYAKKDKNFVLPSKYYTFKKENAYFLALNTAEIFYKYEYDKQASFVQKELKKAANSQWKIAFGHHPFISNGSHGNAGRYDGLLKYLPPLNGRYIERFVKNELCQKVDFYFAGHDHNRQILKPTCGVNFVVSGAGGKTKKWGSEKNPYHWQKVSLGFFYIHIQGKNLTIEAIDVNGKVEYTKTYSK